MPKVFRKSRMEKIERKKYRKYFLYAIGEVILIILGIILAVQINLWIEGKKDQRQIDFLIEKVHHEFESNKKFVKIVDSINSLFVEECDKIMRLFPIDLQSVNLDELSQSLDIISNRIPYRPSQNSIKTLMSSPAFNTLNNEKLERVLLDWNGSIESYFAQESNVFGHLNNEFAPFMNNNFSWRPADLSDPRTDLSVLKTIAFENRIKVRRAKLNALVGSLKARAEEIEEILALTE